MQMEVSALEQEPAGALAEDLQAFEETGALRQPQGLWFLLTLQRIGCDV